ncbi:MAG: demethoxyubiquinone hydroxylase family protein [Myxococcales bacterium]|nr:demethoxyubiquinone hydroxylase family protein [Myxococcales bacterium]
MRWLIFHLKVAYSTEIGASTAYRGHAAATRHPDVAADIRRIEQDELRHRASVGQLLEAFEARPWWWLEAVFTVVGTVIGAGCHVWGGWASAFGAAQFELGGAGDYRRAAAAAQAAGHDDLVARLELYKEQEEAHRRYFLALARWYWRGRRGAPPRLEGEAAVQTARATPAPAVLDTEAGAH